MTIAVLGAGAGGLAAAVELTLAGHEVRLWNRNPARLEPHRAEGIRHRGVLGEGALPPAGGFTSDLAEAIAGVDAVVVCLPSAVHPALFADLAELRCAAPIVLNPGHTGGALHLRQVFAAAGAPLPPVAEFSTLTYVGRVYDGVADITGRAGQVRVGALPGGRAALDWAVRLFPGASPVPDVLASSLSNVNLVLHPPGAILGASWVEATGGAFTFYVEGMTPGVARVLERLDAERLAVARAFGHELPSLIEEMSAVGTVDADAAKRGDTLAAIRGGAANATIPAPDSLEHRYYREDFAFGVLPFIALADVAGEQVPVARSLFAIASALVPGDLHGLSAERLGVAGLSRDELTASVR
ncbi:NAD/NADP-dependent octopine/nopaline dehydrogenase family protein [Leucobacter ruminantium]|uniref:NAD/NADP octopine/nopaline dehydrogenase family protein n=1 Tax=Leucobacter ruminantium TaxID=1289170 RepID=A0A939LYQ1_9MICO|nr:NAD/NADP octopine/nopaline dehydrogenase family protein [Leucobacter ruminantium]MBO1803910.1 NAD/NADP octopine/nopaline dehydrogenase family protein [Leucobacter ruminantium]